MTGISLFGKKNVAILVTVILSIPLSSFGQTATTSPSEDAELRHIIAMLQAQIAQRKAENAALKRQLALSPHAPPAVAAAQGGALSSPPTGITEAALTKGWEATKVREGQATSLQGVPISETIYSLSNGATILVLGGAVDRIFLDPKIGMGEDELLHFNRHCESDGEKPSTKTMSETASEIIYRGPSWAGGAWQATIDGETHKVVAINH